MTNKKTTQVYLIMFFSGICSTIVTQHFLINSSQTKKVADEAIIDTNDNTHTNNTPSFSNSKSEENFMSMINEGMRTTGVLKVRNLNDIDHPNQSAQYQNSHTQIQQCFFHTLPGLNTIIKIGDFGSGAKKRYRPTTIFLSDKLTKEKLRIDISYTKDLKIKAKLSSNLTSKQIQQVHVSESDECIRFSNLNIDTINEIYVYMRENANKNTDTESYNNDHHAIHLQYKHMIGTEVEKTYNEYAVFSNNASIIEFRANGIEDNAQLGASKDLSNGVWKRKTLQDGSVALVNEQSPSQIIEQTILNLQSENSQKAAEINNLTAKLNAISAQLQQIINAKNITPMGNESYLDAVSRYLFSRDLDLQTLQNVMETIITRYNITVEAEESNIEAIARTIQRMGQLIQNSSPSPEDS